MSTATPQIRDAVPGMFGEWRLSAACRGMDPDTFFPPDGLRGRKRQQWVDEAKAVCARCPVAEICRQVARGEPGGVWAGLEPEERGWDRRGFARGEAA